MRCGHTSVEVLGGGCDQQAHGPRSCKCYRRATLPLRLSDRRTVNELASMRQRKVCGVDTSALLGNSMFGQHPSNVDGEIAISA